MGLTAGRIVDTLDNLRGSGADPGGEVAEQLARCERAARRAVPAELLEPAERRVALLLGAEAHTASVAADAVLDDVVADFVEQWVIDVSGLGDEAALALATRLGPDGLMDFVHGLLVVEQRLRLQLMWDRLLLGSGERRGAAAASDSAATATPAPLDMRARRIDAGRHGDRELSAALRDWQAAVVRLDAVDPITTELVRLRCANHHDCHT